MKKFIILIALLINMTPVKPGIGTQLREAVYGIELLRSPSEQLREFSPSVVKFLMNQEIGLKSSQLSRKKIHEGLTKLTQNCHKYFPELLYTNSFNTPEPIYSDAIPIDLGNEITAITELQDGRLACGSERSVLKIIAPTGKVDVSINFHSTIKAIIELNCSCYSGYIAVLLGCEIALINPTNYGYIIFNVEEAIQDEEMREDYSIYGFQELRYGPFKGMILILLYEGGLIVFNPFKKEFFPIINCDLLFNKLIEKTFFEDEVGNLFFITRNCKLIKCSLTVNSEINSINIEIDEIETLPLENVYRYVLNKKGIIAYSDCGTHTDYGDYIMKNNTHVAYKGNYPDVLVTNSTLGMIFQQILPLKNNSLCACAITYDGNEQHLIISIQSTLSLTSYRTTVVITELKDGNLAIGLGNGNILICTLYNPDFKNLSIHQIALLVHLINFEKRCQEDRPEWAPTFHLHPGWYDIFTTLPEVYQNRFKDVIATVDHLQESSLLSKNSHQNPGQDNRGAKRRCGP